MIFDGRPLAILPTLANSIQELALAPRPPLRSSPPAGARTAYMEISGVLDPDYMRDRRELVARLAGDDSVRAIVVYMNSPGGTAEGTAELAEHVRRAAAVKPVYVVAEGYLASAAYWIASQATRIYASPSTVAGSIGVIMVLIDTSRMLENIGIKVIPIATGIKKSAGYPGVPVLDEHVRMLEHWVSVTHAKFEAAIAKGRKLSVEQLIKVSDGGFWHASGAQKLGLVDEVAMPEDAFEAIERKFPAEKFAGLRGDAARDQWAKLLTAELGCDPIDADLDAEERAEARLAKQYPRLAQAASGRSYDRRRGRF
jgi:signal peptide peptidase SppA